ncbi:hypothetical protein BDN72DRAFT_521814 [Pluteus cervinus]|uniref:Uncharacterized protein n=1 Tax=Pluteus cervinus TaxID=181527 RepID=A0ACD3AYP7_9AGAR|nr:hypothetical protein BDN72DRAFT_521814 [Pluteus cervinus]
MAYSNQYHQYTFQPYNNGGPSIYAVPPPHYPTSPPPTYYQAEGSYWGGQSSKLEPQPISMTQPRSMPAEWDSYYPDYPSWTSQSTPPPPPCPGTIPLPPCTPPPKQEPKPLPLMPCLPLASGSCAAFDMWGQPPSRLTSIHTQPASQPPCSSMTFTNPIDPDLPDIMVYPSRYLYVTIGDVLARVSSMRNPIGREHYSSLRRETRKSAKRCHAERVARGVGPPDFTELDVLGGRRYFAGIILDDATNRWNFVLLLG